MFDFERYLGLAASYFGFGVSSFIKKSQQVLETPAQRHARKVERIGQQLKNWPKGKRLRLRKRSVSHQVPKPKKFFPARIDIGDLNEIIDIDPVNQTCVAESGVTFYDLVQATLKHGLAPIITPDLKHVTVGGAVAGCSIESMSFKHGGFHDTCLEYEVITPKGDVMVCTPDNEHGLLFQMAHGTFGTLGIISKLKFKLTPAKPYVHLVYETYRTLVDYQDAIWEYYKNQSIDFMDGFIHSPSEYVLCVGRFVENAPYVSRYDWMKVYYKSTCERDEDYMRAIDYYFRYDRGVTNVHPSSAIGRFFLGKFLGSSQLLWLAEKFHWLLPAENPSVIVDIFVPFSKAEEFLTWCHQEFNFYPLWAVPYKRVRDYEWIMPAFVGAPGEELFLDLAIYGMKQKKGKNAHKIIEDKLMEIGAIKTLISHNYYTPEDFWKIWNKENYLPLKTSLDPHNLFDDLYTKTCLWK